MPWPKGKPHSPSVVAARAEVLRRTVAARKAAKPPLAPASPKEGTA